MTTKMRDPKARPWMKAVVAVVVTAAVLFGEGVFLSDNLHAGTNLLRSHSALKAMFHIPT